MPELRYIAKGYVAKDHPPLRIKKGDVVWLGFDPSGGGWHQWFDTQAWAKPFKDRESCDLAARNCAGQ